MRIRAYATLRDLLGASTIDVPIDGAKTVGQVLQRVVEMHPVLGQKLWDGAGRPTGYVTVLLNGRAIEYLAGMDTPVTEGDVIALFPPVGGG